MVDENSFSDFLFLKELPKSTDFDAIIFTVAHNFYKELNLKKWLKGYKGLVLDSNNIFNQNQINIFKSIDVKYKVVGRGDI